jgi:hypothetical protein
MNDETINMQFQELLTFTMILLNKKNLVHFSHLFQLYIETKFAIISEFKASEVI